MPALACDVSDLKLTYVEQEAGKSADEFESLNQMIWSCELNLDKQWMLSKVIQNNTEQFVRVFESSMMSMNKTILC